MYESIYTYRINSENFLLRKQKKKKRNIFFQLISNIFVMRLLFNSFNCKRTKKGKQFNFTFTYVHLRMRVYACIWMHINAKYARSYLQMSDRARQSVGGHGIAMCTLQHTFNLSIFSILGHHPSIVGYMLGWLTWLNGNDITLQDKIIHPFVFAYTKEKAKIYIYAGVCFW